MNFNDDFVGSPLSKKKVFEFRIYACSHFAYTYKCSKIERIKVFYFVTLSRVFLISFKNKIMFFAILLSKKLFCKPLKR